MDDVRPPHSWAGGWGYPPSVKVVRRGCWVTIPLQKGARTGKERTGWNNYGIEELVKKIDCWRFGGYCLVASYQYYRICATFMIKRQQWADVHRHMGRLSPEGESTTPQEVLGHLRSRRRALRKIETWMTLHVELLFFFRQDRALGRGRVSAPFLLSAKKARQRMKTNENRWGRVHQEQTVVLPNTPAHGPGRVTTDPSLQDLGTASRQLGSVEYVTFAGAGACASGTSDALDVFLGLSPIDGSQECPKMVIGQGATSSRTDLVDEAMCIVCLHGAKHEASVNEDMPSGRTCREPVRDALVGLLPSTHSRDLYDTILLLHGGVEVSSLSSYVGQWVVGSYREREDRYQSMARVVPRCGRVCPT